MRGAAAPAPTGSGTVTVTVFFKAYKGGEFRKLSNLFGGVEWKFQVLISPTPTRAEASNSARRSTITDCIALADCRARL